MNPLQQVVVCDPEPRRGLQRPQALQQLCSRTESVPSCCAAISDPKRFTCDAFDRMVRHRNGGEDWAYFYTADDERVLARKLGGPKHQRWTVRGLDHQVLGSFLEQETSPGQVSWTEEAYYLRLGSQLIAAITDEGMRHFHLDHLGTPRLVTDSDGDPVAFHTYFPYGGEATTANQTDERLKFTGHERDLLNPAGTGDDLDYMHARHHSPILGRFLGVDPAAGSVRLRRGQSWNRFSYVLSSPLKYVDPTGEKWFLIGGKWQFLDGKDSISTDSTDAQGNVTLTIIVGRDRVVGFSGGSLILYDRDGSRKLFGAVSGRVGRDGRTPTRLQRVENRGPIPEGRYYFNPKNIQEYADIAPAEAAAGYVPFVKLGPWPGGRVAWGDYRVELTADPKTNTYGRSGFYIHGGSTPGSAGCIDLCDRDYQFFSAVGRSSEEILVEVDYP
jgi:RHS repeat-associated protein